MRIPRTRAEALDAVAVELRSEQAAALGRGGRMLEAVLETLTQVEQQLATTEGAARQPLLREHLELRKKAETQQWYLVVQREALGLYQHGGVYERFPIPRAIRE